ncbi:hypothetical protein M9H77_11220 [Catharanthus roseus]|uniref:Uncharacterized protein n=1 Tax=Catharanthus roseus TaxID=4058 RepID=A0ACC0BDZ8_CATRO|nr:hypothetical protein M9H77_11220 [Catharanthus roseus]
MASPPNQVHGDKHHHHHHDHDHDHDHDHHHHGHGDSNATSWVGPDGRVYHSHDGLAPHSHEPIYSPGYFSRRAPPLANRDFNERAFTIGIGGPVGTGALTCILCFTFLGADNLAANFSRELADYIIYIIDVSAGDKIPRKGGPGITQADLLVINKTDLAAAVGADLSVMERDALRMRDGGPFVFAQVKHGVGVEEIVNHVLQAWEAATGKKRH